MGVTNRIIFIWIPQYLILLQLSSNSVLLIPYIFLFQSFSRNYVLGWIPDNSWCLFSSSSGEVPLKIFPLMLWCTGTMACSFLFCRWWRMERSTLSLLLIFVFTF
jgi:hypothetical protein